MKPDPLTTKSGPTYFKILKMMMRKRSFCFLSTHHSSLITHQSSLIFTQRRRDQQAKTDLPRQGTERLSSRLGLLARDKVALALADRSSC